MKMIKKRAPHFARPFLSLSAHTGAWARRSQRRSAWRSAGTECVAGWALGAVWTGRTPGRRTSRASGSSSGGRTGVGAGSRGRASASRASAALCKRESTGKRERPSQCDCRKSLDRFVGAIDQGQAAGNGLCSADLQRDASGSRKRVTRQNLSPIACYSRPKIRQTSPGHLSQWCCIL